MWFGAGRLVWLWRESVLSGSNRYQGPFWAKITDAYGGINAIQKGTHLTTYQNHLKYGKRRLRRTQQPSTKEGLESRFCIPASTQQAHVQFRGRTAR